MTIVVKKSSVVTFSLLVFLVITVLLSFNIATIYNYNGFGHHTQYYQNYDILTIPKIYISTDNYTIELISPANGSGFEIGDLVTFKWSGIKDAVNYTLVIDLASNFSTTHLIIVEGITKTEYTLNTSGMSYGLWYWKIMGTLEGGKKVSSRIQVFYIDPQRPPPPGPSPIVDIILLTLAGISPFIVLAGIQYYRKSKKQHKS